MIANRSFEAGDELRYCAGTIANLTEQEEKDLETKTSDFSVIKTSRRGTCLFLGPARFVNVSFYWLNSWPWITALQFSLHADACTLF